jgi:hypothetical protein
MTHCRSALCVLLFLWAPLGRAEDRSSVFWSTCHGWNASLALEQIPCAAARLYVQGSHGSHTSYAWSTGETAESIGIERDGTYTVTITDEHSCSIQRSMQVHGVDAFSVVEVVATGCHCHGDATGSVSALARGKDPIDYVWSNGRRAYEMGKLRAGHYSVTVTDGNGCTTARSVEVLQPPALEVEWDITAAHCPSDPRYRKPCLQV